jgi:hypothetical protein
VPLRLPGIISLLTVRVAQMPHGALWKLTQVAAAIAVASDPTGLIP